MQSLKGAQFLSITSLLVLLTATPAAAAFGNVLVPLAIIYASLWSHEFDLIIDVLNLMLLLSYLPFDSLFSSTQFLVLNLDGWFVVLSNMSIIFWYSYYYINLPSILDY